MMANTKVIPSLLTFSLTFLPKMSKLRANFRYFRNGHWWPKLSGRWMIGIRLTMVISRHAFPVNQQFNTTDVLRKALPYPLPLWLLNRHYQHPLQLIRITPKAMEMEPYPCIPAAHPKYLPKCVYRFPPNIEQVQPSKDWQSDYWAKCRQVFWESDLRETFWARKLRNGSGGPNFGERSAAVVVTSCLKRIDYISLYFQKLLK